MLFKSQRLLVFAEASFQMGVGHVMRSLALAEAWMEYGGQVQWYARNMLPKLEADLLKRGINFSKYKTLTALFQETDLKEIHAESICLMDGYQFSKQDIQWVQDQGGRVLALDDTYDARVEHADWILNQNPATRAQNYPYQVHDGKLLLGRKYVLLRQMFLKSERHNETHKKLNVLITLGGGDDKGYLRPIIEGLSEFSREESFASQFEYRCVLGPGHPGLESCTKLDLPELSVLSNVTQMVEQMQWADIAICAAGSTLWELCYMGIPCFCFPLADNQNDNILFLKTRPDLFAAYPEFDSNELKKWLKHWALNFDGLPELSKALRDFIDGQGVYRVFERLIRPQLCKLDAVTLEDAKLIWDWAQEPSTRSASFNSEPIPWESHLGWFQGKFNDPDCEILIMKNYFDEPVGQIRFEKKGEDAVVSVSISSDKRGLGYGSLIIQQGLEYIQNKWGDLRYNAYIQQGNMASIRSFARAGFKMSNQEIEIAGRPAVLMQAHS